MILNGVIKAIDAKSQAKERGDASKEPRSVAKTTNAAK